MSVVSPFQGLVSVILFTQGDAARLIPARRDFALPWAGVLRPLRGKRLLAGDYRAPLADRCTFTILSSAEQVVVVESPRAEGA